MLPDRRSAAQRQAGCQQTSSRHLVTELAGHTTARMHCHPVFLLLAKMVASTSKNARCKQRSKSRVATAQCLFGSEGPVKVIYLSVDLVYRSAFPLVRVELYPN